MTSQPAPRSAESAPEKLPELKREFSISIFIPPLILQLILLFCGAITTDGGGAFRIFLGALIAHCLGVTLIAARRPHQLTQGDLLYIRWGFFLFYLLGGFFINFWIATAQRLHLLSLFN